MTDMMNVLSAFPVSGIPALPARNETRHFLERQDRLAAYAPYLDAPLVHGFEVDKGHPDGKELHIVNDEAICFVYNVKTLRLVTVKALRVGQLLQYWEALPEGDEDLRRLLVKGARNTRTGLNNA